jgi:hypothetical protein
MEFKRSGPQSRGSKSRRPLWAENSLATDETRGLDDEVIDRREKLDVRRLERIEITPIAVVFDPVPIVAATMSQANALHTDRIP